MELGLNGLGLSGLGIKNSEQVGDREQFRETIAHRIFELAQTHSDRVAIGGGCAQLTFGELADKAARLAEHFRAYMGDKAPIAVASNDTAEMVTAALASWLLGCPYLPLDPACPSHRMVHMMGESGALILAIGAGERRQFPAGPWTAISLVSDSSQASSSAWPEPQAKLEPQARPEDPAYIIYTSGSTGQPKGVIVTHKNLAHFVDWYAGAFSPSMMDRATQFASLTFDASIFEMWPLLAVGASVWPVGRGVALAEKELQNFLVHNAITHCFAPTAIAEELLGLEWPGNTHLRFLLTGADTLRRFPPSGLPFQLVNNYGPTEATVLATSGVIEPSENPSSLPSIGRPIPGAQIYILDEQFKPVAPGAVGEMYIGGNGVAQGYAGQPEMTRERFLDNLFEPGTRLYRTGDKGRLRENGEIEFWGRLDAQLKIRGYRIEPDEIVQKLRAHRSVHVCAVKAIGAGANAQLAVYLELNHAVTSDELREYLADHLPSYMIPDFFVQIDRLPLSERGKINLAELPAPDETNLLPNGIVEEETAKSEIVKELAAIVSQLLKRPSVSTTDNFFRLGGHSLMAAQVISRIRQTFGVELSLRSIFEAPTVQGLASSIEQKILASLPLMGGATGGAVSEQAFQER